MTPSGYRGLLLGARVSRELRYVGTVQWGVSRALLEALTEHVPTHTVSPFTDHRRHRSVVWLEPRVVAEVSNLATRPHATPRNRFEAGRYKCS